LKLLCITLICLCFCFSGYAFAQSEEPQGGLTFSWSPNTEPDLLGYRVYAGSTAGVYDSFVDVGKLTLYTLDKLIVGNEYFVAVTAYDTSGNESGYSVEVVAKAKDIVYPRIPIDFKEVTVNIPKKRKEGG